MVKSAVAAPSIEAVQGLPPFVVVNLRHAFQKIEPRSQEELELLALAVLGQTKLAGAMQQVAKCDREYAVAASTSEALLSLREWSEAKSRLHEEIAKVPEIAAWAHRLVCELCVLHLFVPVGDNLLRPCDGFPFPPRGDASKAA